MQNLLEQLQVKDVTIFELLEGTAAQAALTYDTFLFFPRLGAYLGREVGLSAEDGRDLGLLSELVYLYARLHGSVGDGNGRGVQLEVLLGDLFLGRFYEALSALGKERCLPVYIDFMRSFNRGCIDALTGGAPCDGRTLLICATAEAAALLANLERAAQKQLIALAVDAATLLRPADAETMVTSIEQLAERLKAEQI